jgi:hypothetical protein
MLRSLSVLVFVAATLVAGRFVIAETQPPRTPEPPRYSIGLQVEWSDGSRGVIAGPAQWGGAEGTEWIYPVQFPGQDFYWLLPERGLKAISAAREQIEQS